MYRKLDGPAKQYKLSSVGTSTVVEVVDTTALEERQVITFQSTGKFYLFFGDSGAAPSAAVVAADGFELPRKDLLTFEAADTQVLYVLAVSGTVDIVVSERS